MALGVSNPAPFRVSGRFLGACPLAVSRTEPDTLTLTVSGEDAKQVHFVRADGHFSLSLAAGEHVIRWPEGERPICQGKSFSMVELLSYTEDVDWGLLSAFLGARLAAQEDSKRPVGQAGRIDASDDIARGATVLLLELDAAPLSVSREGAPVETSGHAIYRIVLESPEE